MKDSTTATYDVVRLFTNEYRRGTGQSQEIVIHNTSWEDANAHKDTMNAYHLDDCTQHFYVEASKRVNN